MLVGCDKHKLLKHIVALDDNWPMMTMALLLAFRRDHRRTSNGEQYEPAASRPSCEYKLGEPRPSRY